MARIKQEEVVAALQDIYKRKGKKLHAKDVVDAARSESSPLHHYFEWDDDKAAEQHRIWQARALIQEVRVKIQLPNGKSRDAKVFVSLQSDREHGGYRALVDVMAKKEMRNELVRDAISDMQLFKARYTEIQELAVVFSAMEKARKQLA